MDNRNLNIEKLCWQAEDKEKYILNNISGRFKEGGFYGILGPNGSGKTSLVRHILRFIDVKHGLICLDNKDIKDYSRKELACSISFVPQNVNIDVSFTVYDIVAMGRNPYMKRFQDLSQKDRDLINHAMEVTNCAYLKDKAFSYLSGGEAQRVLVARAIAQDTKYLILDEPISHLDIRYQVELMETLKKLNEEENKTIIAILHDLNLSSAYCKEIFLMKDGKVYVEGSVKDVLTEENLKAVYDINFEIHKMKSKNSMFFIPVV
ncbi:MULTISPECIES: ABC transporter ATP-binding protein [Clostridium]|uniref:ATP-binding cassette domain-containing protein n=1 Tax=Clostridium butyricum TaxID=1492 RepID=A0A6L9ETI7_CLOBU|nr:MULTISPECIES: ABC transporter ATP-binding protein [Clostridium]ETI90329.1 MAG: Ferric enterobactin transport ATP-binding protein FepC [Clostridium butyricum DORA_1]KIU04918.1 ferric enterobactin transport ATP-binding protein FepC [Clostridium butyricum]MBA8968913.1 iron complex transport system ATP-binding protein [Clostridium butyricum]MBA8973230.1 iron complex transport system ATP-binding protein [Clostridium butyricum]MBC2428501.1 ABC transporter ATP-binding protein [Clostridium butyricu